MKNLITEYPSWAIALCPLLGLGFAFLLYFRDRRLEDLAKIWVVILGVLRFGLVTLIAFLLLGPLVRYFQTEIEPPSIVLAIDSSESLLMGKDSINTRLKLENISNQIETALGTNYNLATYSFGQRVREGVDMSFSDPVTDISSLFESLKGRFSNRNLGALIIASDGIYNRGSNPRYAVSGITAPVYTIAMGDTTRRQDALIAEVAANRIAFMGNKFPIEVLMRADKLSGNTLTYSLLKGNDVKETGSFLAEGDRSEKTVRFLLDAEKPGLQRYSVRINAIENEVTLSNNERSVYIDIIDSREKVLILSHAPHPDVFALHNAIASNENYEVNVAYLSDFQGNFTDYNVVVVNQLPSAIDDGNLLKNIEEAEIPIFAIVGGQTNLGDLPNYGLGVRFSSGKNTFNDVGASLNQGFSLFRVNNNFKTFLQDCPPLRSPFGEWKRNNASETILYQKIGSIATNDPLMLATKIGDKKSAVLLGEGIWRWRLYDYAINENHQLFDGFFSSIIQFLSVKDDKRLFKVQSPSDLMENETILLTAELYNASYEPVNDVEVEIIFTAEDGKNYPFTFSRTELAYRLDAGVLPVGNYTFTASANRDGDKLTDSGSIVVRPFALEGAELTANHNLLNSIAENTGGRMIYPEGIDELIQEIKSSKSMQPVSYTTEILSSFLNFKWPFFLILALLSMEWFIRKRSGHY